MLKRKGPIRYALEITYTGAFILIALSITVSCNYTENYKTSADTIIADTIPDSLPEPAMIFGIPSDSFNIIKGHVRRNRFLSDIDNILVFRHINSSLIQLDIKTPQYKRNYYLYENFTLFLNILSLLIFLRNLSFSRCIIFYNF